MAPPALYAYSALLQTDTGQTIRVLAVTSSPSCVFVLVNQSSKCRVVKIEKACDKALLGARTSDQPDMNQSEFLFIFARAVLRTAGMLSTSVKLLSSNSRSIICLLLQ